MRRLTAIPLVLRSMSVSTDQSARFWKSQTLNLPLFVLMLDLAASQKPAIPSFTILSTLSVSNPELRKLTLRLNYPYTAGTSGTRDLPPASTEPLLSNTFPHLTEFSLNGFLEPPPPGTLSTFLSSHPKLRSLTCYLSVQGLILPSTSGLVLPNLEYFEGSALLLAAICEVSESPREKLTKVRVVGISSDEDVTMHMLQAIPKLSKLVDLHVRFVRGENVTWRFMKVLGESCPDLKKLSLQNPEWIGEQVSITLLEGSM